MNSSALINRSPSPQIIVALDYNNPEEALNLCSKLDPKLCRLKVGKELFTTAGPQIINKLTARGYDIFLDLKFHDIPNTIYKACAAACDLGVWMLNVHVSGGEKMLDKAYEAIQNSTHKPLLIGVTVLTSMSQPELEMLGITTSLEDHVVKLAKLAWQHKLDGVVCSAREASTIKSNTCKEFITVTPGIRLEKTLSDDQVRIMLPEEAIANGADYLVIGRPITAAEDPYMILNKIATRING